MGTTRLPFRAGDVNRHRPSSAAAITATDRSSPGRGSSMDHPARGAKKTRGCRVAPRAALAGLSAHLEQRYIVMIKPFVGIVKQVLVALAFPNSRGPASRIPAHAGGVRTRLGASSRPGNRQCGPAQPKRVADDESGAENQQERSQGRAQPSQCGSRNAESVGPERPAKVAADHRDEPTCEGNKRRVTHGDCPRLAGRSAQRKSPCHATFARPGPS